MSKRKIRYVVAIGRKEAELLAEDFGFDTRAEAELHLVDVRMPPTDVVYADQYAVHAVQLA